MYDIPARQIHYRTLSSPQWRTLALNSLDLAHARTVKFVDIHAASSAARRPDWAELTEARHREYLEAFFAQESLKKAMGDLTPMIEPFLLGMRGCTFVDRQP
jgi:hypothetical protein